MKISNSNFVYTPIVKQEEKQVKTSTLPVKPEEQKSLPSFYAQGVSQVNTNLPVQYTKIGEIEVPGHEHKASVFKLENGQKVVIMPKKGATCIKTTYNVGALNEPDDVRGISHFIEHNLFNGSKDLAPREYDKKITKLGAETNASTCYTSTDYFLYLQLLKENSLEEAIKLNALQTQYPTFPSEQIEKEKEPVKSEIDMYLDMPDSVASSIMLKNLFNIQSSSTDFCIGTKDTINGLNREKVLDYYNTWYTPDNAVTVVTGDVDIDETIQLVSKYYNKKPDFSLINKRKSEKLEITNKPVRNDIIFPNATMPSIQMGFAIPEGTSKEDLNKLNSLIDILSLENSPLSQKLQNIGGSLSMYTMDMQNKPDGTKVLALSCNVPNEAMVEDTLKIIYDELNNISNLQLAPNDIENYKQNALRNIDSPIEDSMRLNYTLTDMMMSNQPNYFADKKNSLINLNSQDITNTAKKFFNLDKVSICVAHTSDTTDKNIKDNYNKTNQKQVSFKGKINNPTAIVNETIENVQQYKLHNNVETLFMPNSPQNKATYTIKFKNDDLDKIPAPALQILERMLNEGGTLYKDTQTLKDINTKEAIDNIICVTSSGLALSSSCFDEKLPTAIKLSKEKLLAPNLSQQEFEKAKAVIKDSIIAENKSSTDKLLKELYPNLSIYDTKEERLKQIDALQLSDIHNLYAQIMSNSQVTSDFCGAINEKPQLMNIFNTELATDFQIYKPVTKEKPASYYIHKPITEPKILTDVQDIAQADITQCYTYKETENVTDKAKIMVLNEILGGGMSSRLFTDLREKEKLAYSVGLRSEKEKDSAMIRFYIGTTTESPDYKEGSPDNVRKSLEGFKRNVELVKTQNVSNEELENAKLSLKTKILFDYETSESKYKNLSRLKYNAYGINYDKYLLEEIDKLTADDIRAAANYVFKDKPITSIVANQRTLDALNLKELNKI